MHPAPHNAMPAPAAVAASVEGVSEDDGRTGPGACGQGQLIGQRGVGHREHGQVDRFWQLGEAGQAGRSADFGVAGVDQVGTRPGRAAGQLVDHPRAEAAGARARPDQGDAARLQHGGHRGRRGHLRRRRVRAALPTLLAPPALRSALRSAIAARAACMPGMPHTPPPACVAELA
jgi:hypothetical protein